MKHVFFLNVQQVNNDFVLFQAQESAVMIYWGVKQLFQVAAGLDASSALP